MEIPSGTLPPKFAIPYSKAKLTGRLIMGLVLLGYFLSALIDRTIFHSLSAFEHLCFAYVLLVLGVSILMTALPLFDRRPHIEFNKDGMLVNDWFHGPWVVGWNEVSEHAVNRIRGTRVTRSVLALKLTDPEAYIARQTGRRRTILTHRHAKRVAPILLDITDIAMDMDSFATLFGAYRERYSAEENCGSPAV